MRALLPLLLVTAFLASGCPSAYDRTYQAETQRLQEAERARLQQEEMQRQEASKYVAVVLFATGSSDIDDAGRRELDWFLEKVAPFPNVHIDVTGFADATGSDAKNLPLSNKRAWNVQDYLVSRGVAPDHISAGGFSSDTPARPNTTSKGRRQNRRAEVRVR
jgi:outer membrane protein OmpA-like peptidoglycan-associated protein